LSRPPASHEADAKPALAAAAQGAASHAPLADARTATTPAARKTLKYLASCALDAGTVLTARHEGVDFEFPGGIGLAPEWYRRAMTEEEQRWVKRLQAVAHELLRDAGGSFAAIGLSLARPWTANLARRSDPSRCATVSRGGQCRH
jgi:hypothetical protein